MRDIMLWIKNKDMDSMFGPMDGAIEETLKMTTEKDMEN